MKLLRLNVVKINSVKQYNLKKKELCSSCVMFLRN